MCPGPFRLRPPGTNLESNKVRLIYLGNKWTAHQRYCGNFIKQRKIIIIGVCMLSRFSRVRLCDAMDCSLPASSVHGILQARIREWTACALLQGIFLTAIKPRSLRYPALTVGFFTTSATWEASLLGFGGWVKFRWNVNESVWIRSKQSRTLHKWINIRPGLQSGPRVCLLGSNKVWVDVNYCVQKPLTWSSEPGL